MKRLYVLLGISTGSLVGWWIGSDFGQSKALEISVIGGFLGLIGAYISWFIANYCIMEMFLIVIVMMLAVFLGSGRLKK